MKENLLKKGVNWHVVLLATGLIVISLAMATFIFYASHAANTFSIATQIIPEKNTIALVHFNNINEKTEKLLSGIMKPEEWEWLNSIPKNSGTQNTIAITTQGLLLITNNQNIEKIPENWQIKKINTLMVASNYQFTKNEKSIAINKEFKSVIKNINTSDDIVFYVNAAEWIQNSQRLYFGWKKFLPKTLRSLGGSIHMGKSGLKISAFLDIDKNILPESPLNKTNFFTGSILKKRIIENGSFVAGKELKQVMEKVLLGLEKTNLPLAIELKKGVNEMQKKFFLETVSLESILDLLENEAMFEIDYKNKQFTLLSSAQNSTAMNDIQNSLEEKSRFLSPQKKYYKLPDKTTGAERVANKKATVSVTNFHEVALSSIELANSSFRPTFGDIDNMFFIASSPDEAIKIITNEPRELPQFFKKTHSITFQVSSDTLPSDLFFGKLDEYANTIVGGITLFENGIFIEVNLL